MATSSTGQRVPRTRWARIAGRLPTLLAFALVATVLGPVAPAQAADTVTVDFETGPALGTPVTTQYEASSFVRFEAADIGFRPFRRSAPGQARSGTVAADVGIDVCFPDTGVTCEFVTPGMTGRLTRTASAVTVYAGLFAPSGQAVSAQLTAYRANNSVAGVSPAVPISANGFTSEVRVTSAAPDIAYFYLTVTGPGATNSALGFDDLTFEFPDNSLPDVSISAPAQINSLRQGSSIDVPIGITRLNGSSGPLTMSVAGLPTGVTASFLPNPASGTATTMRLVASDDATPFETPVELTVTADPQGNASVAPEPRSSTTSLVVRTNFEISVVGGPFLRLGSCAVTDLPLRVRRTSDFPGTVTLAVTSSGPTAQILPDVTVPPGGNLIAERTLRLQRTTALGSVRTVTVAASSPGYPSRTLQLQVADAADSATLLDTSGWAPRRRAPGDRIRVEGSGFCPGTRVQVGNDRAEVGSDVAADGRSLTFRIPRTATSGAVTIVPPTGPRYRSTNGLTVRTVRNQDGFAFGNYSYGWLSYSELTDLVGVRDMFIEVNPCWPFGSCSIPTGVPDPVAYLVWGVLNLALKASGGHCFGINRTVQELLAGKVRHSKFAPGVTINHDLPSSTGPTSALSTWLDGRHAGQGTAEFLVGYLGRERDLPNQLSVIRAELAAGRYPGVSLQNGFSGHVVTAYDIEDQPDGSVWVYVYDNNVPFVASEDQNSGDHFYREIDRGIIRISADKSRWEFLMGGSTWSGGGSDLFAVPLSLIPDDPSLPGLNAVQSITIFGAPSGAAVITDVPDDAEFVPVQDSAAVPGSAGFLIAGAGTAISHRVRGSADGTYSQFTATKGFVGGVRDIPTAAGVVDTLTSDPEAGTVTFRGTKDRRVQLDLASNQRGHHRSASLALRTFDAGAEKVDFSGGRTVVLRHDGPATSLRLQFTDTDRRGVDRFTSAPVPIAAGVTVRATPQWGSLNSVRLVVIDKGKRSVRTLKDRSRSRTRLTVATPQVSGKRVKVSFRVKRPVVPSSAGLVVRVLKGQRVVARKAVAYSTPRRGKTLRWKLPRLPKGDYRVVARATLLTSGAQAGTLRDTARTAATL